MTHEKEKEKQKIYNNIPKKAFNSVKSGISNSVQDINKKEECFSTLSESTKPQYKIYDPIKKLNTLDQILLQEKSSVQFYSKPCDFQKAMSSTYKKDNSCLEYIYGTPSLFANNNIRLQTPTDAGETPQSDIWAYTPNSNMKFQLYSPKK